MNSGRGRLWSLVGVSVALSLIALVVGFGMRGVAAQGGAVSIVDFAFQPGSLEVPAGSTVTWTNTGAAPHTVTADDGSFDSGTLSPGASFSQTFNTAGTFSYHCNIHPNMTGTITVTEVGGAQAQPAAAETPAAAAPAKTPAAAVGAAQVPRTGVGTMDLNRNNSVIFLAALAALMLGVAAVAYRRA